MGFRFRKSIKLAPRMRLNVGKKSVGVSVGGKGARISTNTRSGTRVTVSSPGTGLSYSQKIGGRASPSGAHARASSTPLLPAMEAAQWASLEEGQTHLVEVSAHSIEWLSLCACCGEKLAPLAGAKEIAPAVWASTQKINVFVPFYCSACLAHQDGLRSAWSVAVPGDETVAAAGAGAGFLGGCFLWIMMIFTLGMLGVSGTALFWAPLAVAGITGAYFWQQGKIKAQENIETATQQRESALTATRARLRPQCTCCGPAVWIEESHGTRRLFAFRSPSLSRAFAQLNSKKVV